MKLLAVILSVALIASVSGQDMLRTMMLMRMLGGNNNSGSNSPARGSSASTGATASMLGMGRGGFNPALLALGGGRVFITVFLFVNSKVNLANLRF